MSHLTPLQGSPDEIASSAADMQSTANAIQQAARALRQFTNLNELRSHATEAVAGNAIQLAGVLTEAHTRYKGAADALANYAPKLRNAQALANEAIRESNSTNVGSAQHQVDHNKLELLNPTLSPADRDYYHHQLAIAEHHLGEQQAAVGQAHAKYEQAVADRDAAAFTAAQQIQDAMANSHLNDSIWDKIDGLYNDIVKPALKDFLEALDQALSDLSIVITVLEVVFLVVSFFAPEIGLPVLGLLSVINEIVSITDFAVKLDRFALGDLTLGELLVAATSLAVSTLVGMGVTKLVTKGFVKLGATGTEEGVKTFSDGAGDVASDPPGRVVEAIGDHILKAKNGGIVRSILDYKLPDDLPPPFTFVPGPMQPIGQLIWTAHEYKHHDVHR